MVVAAHTLYCSALCYLIIDAVVALHESLSGPLMICHSLQCTTVVSHSNDHEDVEDPPGEVRSM